MDFLKNFTTSRIRKNYKVIIIVFLIIGMLISTFVYSIQNGMHHTVTKGFHTKTIAIAISKLKFGLTGYQGYSKIYNILTANGMPGFPPEVLAKYKMSVHEILTNADILNNAIKMAINVDNVSGEGQFSLEREDVGMITYQELSFRIFGFNVESFLYLYYLLLFVSVLIFLLTYLKRIDLLNLLLLFVCSHYVIVAIAPLVGDLRLQTVHNDRFFSVLGILPTMYLSLLGLSKTRLSLAKVVGATIQVLILLLVIQVRSAAVWQMMFLIAAFVLTMLWYWLYNPETGRYVVYKISFWVPTVVLLCFILVKMHSLLFFHYSYNSTTSNHLFWHSMILGLSAHPDSMSKYGLVYNDPVGFEIVNKRSQELYGTEDWYSIGGYTLAESILKDEYIKIVINDPKYFVENYLYKFLMFFENYFSRSLGVVYYFFSWPLIFIIMVGSFLAGEIFIKRSRPYLFFLIIGIAFSLLPTMVGMPLPYLIADPATMLTFLIYMIISIGVGYTIQLYKVKNRTAS
jgi:hypothetical protein